MIGVTLHENGRYWQAKWRDARGRQRGKSLGRRDRISRRAARKLVEQLAIDLNTGRVAQQQAPTLQEHANRYLANKPNLAEGTVELYTKTIRYLVEFFGAGCRIDAIDRPAAADWRAALARGELAHVLKRDCGSPSEATVCQATRDAKALFQAATDEDSIPYNPFSRLPSTPTTPNKDWEYIDRDRMDRLLAACPSASWRLLLALCRWGGCRQGEALRMEWADVDLVERTFTVRPAGRYATTKQRLRTVPIAPRLYELLSDAMLADGQDQRVCPGLHKHNLWRDFQVICRRSGLAPWARWCHTLRKNAETDWAAEHSIHVVTDWLGNSPEVAMRRYLKPTASDFAKATGQVPDGVCSQTRSQTAIPAEAANRNRRT